MIQLAQATIGVHWSKDTCAETLCRVATDYDARSRKIRRVAQPEVDTDAVNKLYLELCIKTLMIQQRESDEKLTASENDVRALQITINELISVANTTSETAITL